MKTHSMDIIFLLINLAGVTFCFSPPIFLNLPKDETVVELDTSLSLPCSASGNPQPKIVNWLFNNNPVNFGTSAYSLKANGDLYILKASKRDAGYYQCVASNSVGGVVSEKRKVIVAYFKKLLPQTVERLTRKRDSFFLAAPPQIESYPKPKYIWKKDGIDIVEDERKSISADGDLVISNLQNGDSGSYHLIIENTFLKNKNVAYSSQKAKEVALSVYDRETSNYVKIVYSSKKQTAGEQKTMKVVLECFISALPLNTVQISWKKVQLNNAVIDVPISSKYKRLNNGRRLEIYKPTFGADNGVFKCATVIGINVQTTADIELDVFSIPQFGLKPQNVRGFTDNSTNLNCTSVGYPSRVTRWYRNGIPVVNDDNHFIHANNTLSLKKLNWEDQGVFQCAADNFAAIKFAQVQVEVQNVSTKIENEFRDIFVGYDTTVIVPCVATGAPKPLVYWTLNSTRLLLPKPKYTLESNGSLIITRMSDAESGVYECVANNRFNIARKSCKVWVVVKTRIVKFPPREFKVQKGDNAELPCKVEHDPNIKYTREWRHNNLPVKNERYVVKDDGTLVVNLAQESDTGIDFSCHVFSSGGNVSIYTLLVIVQLPLEPSSPRPVEVLAHTIKLEWDIPADGGSPLTKYQLYIKNETMTNFELFAQPPANTSSIVINNLRPGARFKFKVAARNKFGIGKSSPETAWIQTKTLAPSAAPYGLKAHSSGMHSVSLSWEIPPQNTHNGRLLGYYIGFRLSGSTKDYNLRKVLGGDSKTHTIKNLPISTQYEIRIAAFNDAGTGRWSAPQYFETSQGTPAMPPTDVSVSVFNDTSVEITCNLPPQASWNGKLSRLVAHTWHPTKPREQSIYTAPYDPSSLKHQKFLLPNLSPDTEYALAVAVGTTGGVGPLSDEVQFKTSEGVPDSVRDLQVLGIYSDAFSVSWKEPKRPAGVLRGYRVQYRRYNIGDWSKPLEEPATAKGAVISNLQPLTRYEVKVVAYTAKGEGSPMSASVTTINTPVLPKAPSQLRAIDTWGTNMSLGWIPGDSGRAVILYYLIEYNNDTDYNRNPSAAKWRIIRNLTKILENPANLTHLKPSTVYRFRMKAFNRVGASPYSNISDDILTGEGIPSQAPLKITASAPERQALLIKWTPPSKDSWNSGSIKYQFLIKPKDQDPKIKTRYKEHPATQATSYMARGLQKYTMYNITIRLFNEKGYGPWSHPIFARTSEDFPAGAPTNVVVMVIDSSSVRVNWGPVPENQRNGVVLGYKVYYQMKNQPETELFKQFDGNKTYTGVINHLAGYTDYEFRLLAYTKVGGRFESSPVTVKTHRGVPGKPRDVRFNPVTYTMVTVRWNIPARPNGDILFYEVKYRQNVTGAKWTTVRESIGAFSRQADIKALVFNAYYVFEIRAKSAAGWSEAAVEYLLVTTDRETPESPVILAIPLTAVRTRSIVVSWRPRFEGNSPIRAYNLQYNREFEEWKTYKFGVPPLENIPASTNELEVLGLDPASSYQFRVRAANDIGASSWSDKSKIQTTHPDAPLGAAYNVHVPSKTPTSLVIAWEPPKLSVYKLRGYKIKYKELSGIGGYKEIPLTANQLQHRITNLKVFTAYQIQMGAYTDEGKGTFTPFYIWRTGEALPEAAPTNVKVVSQGPSKIRITWEAPDLESVRGYTLGFKIESERVDGTSRRRRSIRTKRALTAVCTVIPAKQTHLAGPYTTEVTLKNLRKFTKYVITVRVYNSFGDGPKSIPVTFNTPKDVPGPPYILSERVYTNLIDIDFAQPCEPNGQILGYRIQYREKFGKNGEPLYYGRDDLRVRVSDLKTDTTYFLELSAKTSVGYGQKATIDFHTKLSTRPPTAPGAPLVYENKPAVLTLKWEEGDNGNMPITTFYIKYRRGDGDWTEHRPIQSSEVKYDESLVVYSVLGLKNDVVYYFKVKSKTVLGESDYGPVSKPIRTAMISASNQPLHKKVWFIFLLIIIALLLIIVIVVCCWYHQCRSAKYKTNKKPYTMSSFEMAMVSSGDGNESSARLIPGSQNGSRNGSNAPSVASSKKPPKKYNERRTSANSLMKSIDASDNDADKSSDEREYERRRSRNQPENSIANHYSNDPFHKNWRDSMDKKTKKAILAEYGRRSSQASVDTLEEKRAGSVEYLDRPRGRPGRPDLTERKKLARSEPFLADETPESGTRRPAHQPRRPGRQPIDRDIARSEPDLNRPLSPPDSQVTRQPSFLRATAGNSDNESLNDVYERQKSKREMAMDEDNRMDNFYLNGAPPPYDYCAAPPAYSPSEQDDDKMSDTPSNRGYTPRTGPYNPPKNRFSDFSDSSDGRTSGRFNPPPPRPNKNYYNPQREYAPPQRQDRSPDPRYPPEPEFSPRGNFSPPQNSRFDDEYLGEDELDGYEPELSLV